MSTYGVYDNEHSTPITFGPQISYSSISLASGTILATSVCGAAEVYLSQSGATALTLPTAASVYSQLQSTLPSLNGTVSWYLRIINTNGGTLTLTAGTGNTITGTATLATQTFRDFVVTLTGPTTVTYQSVGTGTNS